jgi:Holliday junction resolvase RusA-like endonuclease
VSHEGRAVIEFVAYGHPQPKGSMTRMPNGKMVGGRTSRAKDLAVRRAHAHRIAAWPLIVASAARAVWGGPTEWDGPFDLAGWPGAPRLRGPLNVCARFYLKRPASKARRQEVFHTSSPDLDKLLRHVCDVLVRAGVIWDDRYVVCFNGSEKRWAAPGATAGDAEGPRVEVVVTRMADSP